MTEGGRLHLMTHPSDNVTTLLDDRGDIPVLLDGFQVSLGVCFGHKVALQPISKGAPILKYQVVIGHATADIKAGEHVHVHNCR
ncbi:MAG: D-galactarate dehydratase [Rhodospirillaceae bacterium]|nr:D-galactarate dehydratase [Rhodospirillaceae bacterium]|tara:strand:+ start:101 stop:352 length:252 start_codon:yes stop_codon:yes gene_type:complete